jgi:hypothetical protein
MYPARRGPERLMGGCERSGCAGLDQGDGLRQRAGLAEQDLQVMVQVEDLHAPADGPLLAGDDGVLVVDGDRRG